MTDYLLIRRRVINIYYVLITRWAIVGRILVFQVLAEEKLQAIHITANSPAHDRSQHRENDEAETVLSAIFNPLETLFEAFSALAKEMFSI